MTDPTSPATIARADERRPAGIEDESLTDHIIDDLTEGDLVHCEPISLQYWTDDLPGVITRVAHLVRTRDAQHLRAIAGMARARGETAHAAGYSAAAAIVESGGAA